MSFVFCFFFPVFRPGAHLSRPCRVAKRYAATGGGAYIRSRIPHLGILCPLALPLLTPRLPMRSSDPPRDASDNAAEIILVTRHATCRCNFAAISNFLGWLAPPPSRLFLLAEGEDEERTRIGIGCASRRWARGWERRVVDNSGRANKRGTRVLRCLYTEPTNFCLHSLVSLYVRAVGLFVESVIRWESWYYRCIFAPICTWNFRLHDTFVRKRATKRKSTKYAMKRRKRLKNGTRVFFPITQSRRELDDFRAYLLALVPVYEHLQGDNG